jgi:spore germination cell wall hydrolase CwlJ-like protein
MSITRHIPIAVFCGALLLSTASCEHFPPPAPAVASEWCCMFKNIYHEARGEGVAGMQAVAAVTLNRAAQTGESVCDVVYARKQFSWTNTTKGRNKPIEGDTSVLYIVVAQAMSGAMQDITGGATHYHTKHVNPVWRKALNKVAVINNHIFYRKN